MIIFINVKNISMRLFLFSLNSIMSQTTYALLIGINYVGQRAELNGCINDVNDIKNSLVTNFHVPPNNITVMTDESNNNEKPTKSNIISKLVELVIMAYRKKITKLIIHYSGHGYYVRDKNNDEEDLWDEVICPVDYITRGFITDDTLNSIFRIIPTTCEVFALVDSCNSGTALDLKYRHVYGDEHAEIETNRKSMRCPIVMISGCKDDQDSADAYISGKYNGAMTKAFLHSLKEAEYNVTYFHLLKDMRQYLKDNNFTQIPQLSSSNKLSKLSTFCRKSSDEPFMLV